MKVAPLILTLLLTTGAARAENPAKRTFSLEQAIRALHDGNLRLRASKANELAARESTAAAGRWQNPQLDVDYFYGVRKSSYDNVGTGTIGVSQLLETAGAPASRREAAQHEETAVRAESRGLEAKLELDVEQAYVALAAQIQIAETYARLAIELKEAERIIAARLAAGTTTPYAAQRIALAHAEARAQASSAEADIVNLRNDLNTAVGASSSRLIGDPVFSLEPRELPPLTALLNRQRSERHDLAAARARVAESRANVESAKRNVFRGVAVRVAAGFGQGPGQVDLGVGLSIPLPVVDGGGPSIRSAEHTATASSLSADALTIDAERELRTVYGRAQSRLETSRDYAQRTREPSERIIPEAEAGFREARLGVLELVDAYRTSHDAAATRIRLSRDATIAEIELRRAVVGGR